MRYVREASRGEAEASWELQGGQQTRDEDGVGEPRMEAQEQGRQGVPLTNNEEEDRDHEGFFFLTAQDRDGWGAGFPASGGHGENRAGHRLRHPRHDAASSRSSSASPLCPSRFSASTSCRRDTKLEEKNLQGVFRKKLPHGSGQLAMLASQS